MMRNMRRGVPNLFKQGTQHFTGLEAAVMRNVEACENLAKITRTSLGPNGMNKMVINHLDKLFVTNDAATIMREMEVAHPAAKLIVLAAQMQEQEVGDGSNFVVVLVGELLKQAAVLIKMGLHPREVLDGYLVAGSKALELIEGLVVETIESKDLSDPARLSQGIYAAVASKQYGEEKFLSGLVAEACAAVMPKNPYNFLVDNVRVVKLLGGSLHDSEVVRGMVIDRSPRGVVKAVDEAKIAVFTCALDSAQTETKGTVLLNTADELLNYSHSEEKAVQQQIQVLADCGINVVVTTGSIGDMAQHFLDKLGILTIKIQSQWQMRRICRATKARPMVALGHVRPDQQGYATRVAVREVGEARVTVFSQAKKDSGKVATIVLRGSTQNILNDVERAVDDAVNVVRMMSRDGRFVAGAGAVDIELARLLHLESEKHAGLAQYAIKSFGDAMEAVPRTLSENAGMDEMKTVSQLYAAHEAGNTKVGVDIEGRAVKDMTQDGIIDLLATRVAAMKLAVDTAVTVLRVDQIIMAKPAGGPKMPKKQGHWDDD